MNKSSGVWPDILVTCIGGKAAGKCISTPRDKDNFTVTVDTTPTNKDNQWETRRFIIENYRRLNLSIVGLGNICVGVHESLLVKDFSGVNLQKTYENVLAHYCKLTAELEEAKRYAAE